MSENGITRYCLGNGALKCDGCGQEKNWQTLNQMPDTLRKRRFNSCDKRNNEAELISVLVLTEFSHWEQKSQNMIKAYIDKNFVVRDDLIVDAFTRFEAQFGEGFYEKITKACFESDEEVRKLALQVVNEHEGKIFLDLDDGEIKRFAFVDGNLVFEV